MHKTFPSTHWAWIAAAGEQNEQGMEALGKLLQHYEPALKRYLIDRFRCGEDRAQDWFQGFVMEIILEKRMIAQTKQRDGHLFRSFLLSALNNYVASELRRQRAQKREPSGGLVSLDEADEPDLPADQPWAYNFDLLWARSVLTLALQRMEAECAASGRDAIWGVFEHRLQRPILEGVDVTPYEELVTYFGFASPAQAQNALITAKRMFGRALRAVVAEYTSDETAVEVELRELQCVLSSARPGTFYDPFGSS